MTKFNVQQCPVCSGKEFFTFLTCTDFFVSQEEFQIKQCSSCGLKITENVEDEKNIGRYYQSEQYISHSNTSQGLINRIYHGVRKWMLGRKRKLVENITGLKSGQILDEGAGTGIFQNEMKRHGWQVTGTEKSNDARQFAKTEFNLGIFPSENLFTLTENHFDVITLWHVLEHIQLLNENMEFFRRLLKENGKLVIAVPNHDSYDARHYKQFWAAWDVPRHIWHFTPRPMNRLAKNHGFTITGIYAMSFDPFYVSLLSEKYKKSKVAFLKGFFFGKISWLNSVFKPGKCSSVIYVLEKELLQ